MGLGNFKAEAYERFNFLEIAELIKIFDSVVKKVNTSSLSLKLVKYFKNNNKHILYRTIEYKKIYIIKTNRQKRQYIIKENKWQTKNLKGIK